MTRIGHYELLERIGQGGMGAVWRARDPRFDRHVAVKLLHAQFVEDPGVVERFKAEAIIQAKLKHPHIASVYDFVAEPGALAIVMEFIDGLSLAQLVAAAGGPIPPARATRLVTQVLSAVGAAHRQGLVHRDLKPSNVLVETWDDEEHVKVLDFGIAKIRGAEKGRTATGATMGTLAYMSPEHVRSPKHVDPRSDVYAIGVLLYELLAGRPPFDADTEYDLMRAIVEAPPPDLGRLNVTVPAALAAVAARALQKVPESRFQSCDEMRTALRAAVSTPPGGVQAPFVTPAAVPETLRGAEALGGHRHAASTEPVSGREVAAPRAPAIVRRALPGDSLDWVRIPAGTFEMGAVPHDRDAQPDEHPRHTVRLTRSFELTRAPVTVGQYREFVRATPNLFPAGSPRLVTPIRS